MKCSQLLLCGFLFACGTSLVAVSVAQNNARHLTYHDRPSTEPLPDTLSPSQFTDDHIAFVVYSLAAQIKQTLFQVPCYCPCDRRQGHTSLLDCYRDRHGVACPTCQKELLFCFREHQKGKTPAAMRDAIAQGKAWSTDVANIADRMYLRMLNTQERKPTP